MYALKTPLSSPADDWIVIAKQLCVCALKELRNERLEKGLGPRQWMQIVKVNLLKTETSWGTRGSIAGRKQAMDLDNSAAPPLEAADNFLMHLRGAPPGPDETAREHIQRTIPITATGSVWIPPQVSNYELQVCSIYKCEASQSAIWLRILLLCRLIQLRSLDRSSCGCTTRSTQRCGPWIVSRRWTHQ